MPVRGYCSESPSFVFHVPAAPCLEPWQSPQSHLYLSAALTVNTVRSLEDRKFRKLNNAQSDWIEFK